jgi:hypothetical protein
MYRLSGRTARSSFLDLGRPAAERTSSSSARIRRMDVIRWALLWDLSKPAWRGTGQHDRCASGCATPRLTTAQGSTKVYQCP